MWALKHLRKQSSCPGNGFWNAEVFLPNQERSVVNIRIYDYLCICLLMIYISLHMYIYACICCKYVCRYLCVCDCLRIGMLRSPTNGGDSCGIAPSQ